MSLLDPTEFFALDRPCGNCPFRTDKPPFPLRRERAEEIADSLRRGESFVCHRTVDYTDRDEETPGSGQDKARMCAGARATLARETPGGEPRMIDAEQMARRMYMMGLLTDPVPELSEDIPVPDGLDSWIERIDSVRRFRLIHPL